MWSKQIAVPVFAPFSTRMMASKLRRDLSNVAVQLRSGQTRGANPRKLTDDEVEDLRRRHDCLRAHMSEARKQRIVARVNAHTTEQSERVITASAGHSQNVIAELTKLVNAAKSEIMEGGSGTGSKLFFGHKIRGRKVKAAQPDTEMGDDIYDVVHVEQQTFPDGQKHTVCLIKAEGKVTLSREFCKLSLSDPFAGNGLEEQVRVVVVSMPPDNGLLYHVVWRGTVQRTRILGSPEACRVNFSYLREGKIANKTVVVSKEHLQILRPDQVSMEPNKHPWVGEVVRVDEGVGKIVHVTEQGRVKILLDSKRKRFAYVESRGASFDQLFSRSSAATEVSQQPQAAPAQQAAEEPVAHADVGPVLSVADSDAESDAPGPAPLPREQIVPAEPKRRRAADKKKAKPSKKRAAEQPAQPKRAGRRRVASPSGREVD